MSTELQERTAKCANDGDLEGLKAALAEGAWVDHQDAEWLWSPLFWAIYASHQRIVEYLCTMGRADTNLMDKAGKMPLHVAW